MDVMVDDLHARIAELEAEVLRTQVENAMLREREAALLADAVQHHADMRAARERQTSTAAILALIADGPANKGAILDAIVDRARQVCAAFAAQILLVDGDEL